MNSATIVNGLKWWFRVVGAFYPLLTLRNLYFLFLGSGRVFAVTLPAPMNTDPLTRRAFMDAWMVFVFEPSVLGAMALAAARRGKTRSRHGSLSGRRSFAAL